MRTIPRMAAAALAAVGLFSGAAQAHVLGGAPGGFAPGFAHPVQGIDHVAVMIGVGLLAVRLGGPALWLVPAAFLAAMAAGFALGVGGVGLPLVETAILASLIGTGLLVLAARSLPASAAVAAVGLFAVFHGQVHGAEMPVGGSALGYAAGFLLTTAILHLSGMLAGIAARARPAPTHEP